MHLPYQQWYLVCLGMRLASCTRAKLLLAIRAHWQKGTGTHQTMAPLITCSSGRESEDRPSDRRACWYRALPAARYESAFAGTTSDAAVRAADA